MEDWNSWYEVPRPGGELDAGDVEEVLQGLRVVLDRLVELVQPRARKLATMIPM